MNRLLALALLIVYVALPDVARARCYGEFLESDELDVEFREREKGQSRYDFDVRILANPEVSDDQGNIYRLESIQFYQDAPALNSKLAILKAEDGRIYSEISVSAESLESIKVSALYFYFENSEPKCPGTATKLAPLDYYLN